MSTLVTQESLWTIHDVSEYLGVAVATLYRWRTQNYGPRGMKVGRFVRYRPDEVVAWLDSVTDTAS